MRVGLHMSERTRHVIKRKSAVDGQGQLAGLDRWPEVSVCGVDDGAKLVGRARAKRHADVVYALERVEIEVEVARRPTQPTDIDDAPENRRRLHVHVGDAG